MTTACRQGNRHNVFHVADTRFSRFHRTSFLSARKDIDVKSQQLDADHCRRLATFHANNRDYLQTMTNNADHVKFLLMTVEEAEAYQRARWSTHPASAANGGVDDAVFDILELYMCLLKDDIVSLMDHFASECPPASSEQLSAALQVLSVSSWKTDDLRSMTASQRIHVAYNGIVQSLAQQKLFAADFLHRATQVVRYSKTI